MTTVGKYVQFGAGLRGPDNWLNFDVSPTLRLQRLPLLGRLLGWIGPKWPKTVRYGDIICGLPVGNESCDAIYCSHVLEHLSLADFRLSIRNTFQHLKPGGTFRFVLPDLEKIITAYNDSNEPAAAVKFIKDTLLGREVRSRGFVGRLRDAYGNSAHLWMWDYRAIEIELHNAGFVAVRRAEYGDSGNAKFEFVESIERWTNCLGVNCLRPLSPSQQVETLKVRAT